MSDKNTAAAGYSRLNGCYFQPPNYAEIPGFLPMAISAREFLRRWQDKFGDDFPLRIEYCANTYVRFYINRREPYLPNVVDWWCRAWWEAVDNFSSNFRFNFELYYGDEYTKIKSESYHCINCRLEKDRRSFCERYKFWRCWKNNPNTISKDFNRSLDLVERAINRSIPNGAISLATSHTNLERGLSGVVR